MDREDTPKERAPYRTAPLGDLRIAPDRRLLYASLLFLAGAIFGGLAWRYGAIVWARRAQVADVRPAATSLRGRAFPACTLEGPGGPVALPTGRPVVVNVWLQGCADCMQAFEAARAIDARGGYRDLDVVNVAYGSADPTWAKSYGVDSRLVFDEGGAKIVKPLGIGTFTTLVVDAKGIVRLVDRPDRAGHEERVRGAALALAEP